MNVFEKQFVFVCFVFFKQLYQMGGKGGQWVFDIYEYSVRDDDSV